MEDSGIDSDPKPSSSINTINHNDDKLYMTSENTSGNNHQGQDYQRRFITNKQLQRKLEARIQQAKRIQRNNTDYIKISNNDCKNNTISSVNKLTGLIPIQRLSIPNNNDETSRQECYPLVEYWQSDLSESEDEMTLYPLSRNKHDITRNHKQDLITDDTFSIQESSDASEDSLNLIGPTTYHQSHLYTRTCTPIGCFTCPCRIL